MSVGSSSARTTIKKQELNPVYKGERKCLYVEDPEKALLKRAIRCLPCLPLLSRPYITRVAAFRKRLSALPGCAALQIRVYDEDLVGSDDDLGYLMFPLAKLTDLEDSYILDEKLEGADLLNMPGKLSTLSRKHGSDVIASRRRAGGQRGEVGDQSMDQACCMFDGSTGC
eukprot:357945-Chlamydomonas_euryale.AAC.4